MTVTIESVKPKPANRQQETDTRAAASATAPAFEAAFHKYWPRVYGVLFRIVGDPAEAEDLAMETFWRLYRRPPRQADNPGGWLYRVATNLGFNALRARKRRTHRETEAGRLTLEASPPPDPAIEVERIEERERVRAVLAQMKLRSARLLVLRHSGLSYAELADTLGVAVGSIGTLLARAEREFERRYRATWDTDFSDAHG